MAFVVIQHLDPGHPSMLAAVLGGYTRMPVVEAAGGMRIEPNRVYVIPPSSDLTLQEGILALIPRQQTGKLHLPIDFFFEALAQDQRGKAVGVVLSGSGSDGTQGLLAIKAEGGITFAQEPESASFRSMPESALAAGAVDFRLLPEEIAKELVRLSHHPYLTRAVVVESSAGTTHPADAGSLGRVLAAVRERAQLDFTSYKRPTVLRRVARRMALRRVSTMSEYAEFLRGDSSEAHHLAEDILIHVTSFFRDPAAFAALKDYVFPELLKHKKESEPIRIWAVGCSSGEEVYSLAICLLEFLGSQGSKVPIKFFGSDLSEQAIGTARTGLYPAAKLEGVSAEQLARYFDREEGGYRVNKCVRDCCVFVKHDLTRDPPFAKLDLISCRNVLIYFDMELQQRIVPLLHYCLNQPGYLFLGCSESIAGFSELFAPLDKAHRIYRKTGDSRRFAYPLAVSRAGEATLLAPPPPSRQSTTRDVERQADHYLLARYAPAGVIVNERLEIVQFRGRTGAYLEPPPGQPQANLVRMVRSGLVSPLQEALEAAKTHGVAVHKEGVRFQCDTVVRDVNLAVVPLPSPQRRGDRYFLVLFEEPPAHPPAQAEPRSMSSLPAQPATAPVDSEAVALRTELASTRGYLETLLSEHQSATDELAATNEELVASNEELQSTNEELQGTHEELQSTNEELSTVNDELRNRNQALDLIASDLTNVLDSVKIAIIILDGEMRIRRFTPMAREVSNLLPGDVGRLLDEVKLKVKVDNLSDKIRETMESLTPKEWEIQGLDERWLRLQIRPYRGGDNRLSGVLLSFVDVDILKRALLSSEQARDFARSVVETVPTALVVLDSKLRVFSSNQAFSERFGASARMTEGSDFFALSTGTWQVAALREAIERALTTRLPFRDLAIRCEFPGIGRKELSIGGCPIVSEGERLLLLLSIDDITERRLHEEERALLLASAQSARGEAERANRAKDLFLATLSHELRTPLSAILLSAQFLSLIETENPLLKRTSASIERQVKAQTRLIDDLLDIARITSGKLLLDLQAVDLATVIRSAVDVMRGTAEAKGVALEVAVSDTLGPIYGDPARLQQIVANLLGNSIKFTPKGGKVLVCLEEADGWAEIQVSDTGIGIKPEMLPRLFDRFVQADSEVTRLYGGLGLGLAIVRHLVDVHGGQVLAESAGEGQGATFRVLLPFAERGSLPSPPAAPQAAVCSIQGVRVLLIDDEVDCREAFSTALKMFGANVMATGSAAEGLAAVEKFRPQVILCDIAMPVEDGYSFIRKLRSQGGDHGGQTPAAALTALAGLEDRRRALSAGYQLHLVKPIDATRLAAAVGALSGLKQPRGTPTAGSP